MTHGDQQIVSNGAFNFYVCMGWFSVPCRFYKKASFYNNRCREEDGGGVDNFGGDLK